MNQTYDRTLSRYSVLLGLIAVLLVLFFLWAVDKGFDVTDEGLYLLAYTYPKEYSSGFSSFNLIVSKILSAETFSVIGYRIASLTAGLISALLLASGLWQWISKYYKTTILSFWLLFATFVIGNSLHYSVLPRTIYYNDLNSLFIVVYVSSVLTYLATINVKPTIGQYLFLYLGGAFIGLDIFVKGSSSLVALTLGLGVLIFVSGPTQIAKWYKPVGWVLVGFVSGVLLFFGSIQAYGVWSANFIREMQLLLKSSYNGGLLIRYLHDAYPVIRTLIFPFAPFVLLSYFLTRSYLRGKLRVALGLQIMLASLIVAFLGYEALRTSLLKNAHLNYNRSSVWFISILLIVLAAFCAAYLEKPLRKVDWRKLVVGFWLVLLPFVGALGTYNNLFINIMIDINYWLSLLCVLFVSMPDELRQRVIIRLLVFVLPALFIAEQVGYGLLVAPYLQATGMAKQTVPFTFGKTHTPATLKLDAKTAEYMTQLTQTMREAGFKPGMPIIAIYDTPGLVYMLGGISPGNPWFFGQLDLRNCDSFEKTKLPLTDAFVLVNERPGPELLACMQSHGINFPQGYKAVNRLLSPYNPNQYNWRNYQDTLTVYAPLTLPMGRVVPGK